MPETREKLEFSTNVPVEITLGKNFKSGTGQWGAWHGWNVFQGGAEKVIFAKDALHDKIKGYGEGAKLTITYAEKKGDSGLYHEWEVSNGNGGPPPSSATQAARREPRVERDAPRELDIESHLLACADIAGKIAEKLGLLDDSASIQACFATVAIDCQRHNVILGDSVPPNKASQADAQSERKEALMKGVRSACKLLNDEGYDPPFNQKRLDEFVAEKFGVQSANDLTAEDTEYLIHLLSEKLDDFRLTKTYAEERSEDDDVPF